jgi:hypothetical protein
MSKKVTTAATVVALALALAATAAAAPGKPAPSSLSLVVLTPASGALLADASSPGGAHWGDAVTFTVATTATDRPYVTVNCYQSGVWVLTATAGFYADYGPGQTFGLSNTTWTGGAADCTAELDAVAISGKGAKQVRLATTSFHVDA